MSTRPSRANLVSLLEHEPFVRRVVARLLHDDADIDDVVQDTWIRAAEHGPARPEAGRAWLARVARNLALTHLRTTARRVRREETVARPERVGHGLTSVERLRRHEQVVAAVMALPEPLRSAVVERYYEELPPREIARRHGVPVTTIRSWTNRAIERLREDLDRGHGGSRASWSLALAPLLAPPNALQGAPASLAGTVLKGAAMAKAKTTAVSLAVLLLLGVGALLVTVLTPSSERIGPEIADAQDASVSVGGPEAPSPTRRHVRTPPTSHEREPPPRSTEPAPEPLVAPPPPPDQPDGPAGLGEVVGRVLLLPGRVPVAGADVRCTGVQTGDTELCTTGRNGVFRIGGLSAGGHWLRAKLHGHPPRALRVVVPTGAGVDDLEVLFGSGGAVEGRVAGPAGPEVDVPVRANSDGTYGGSGLVATRTDAAGSFRLEDLPGGRYVIEVGASGAPERRRWVTVVPGEVVRADFAAGAALSGTVFLRGTPVAAAIVRAHRSEGGFRTAQARTDDDGTYRIEGLAPGEWLLTVQTLGEGAFAVDVAAPALHEGENRLDVRVGEGELAGEIVGRVFVRSSGTPVSFPSVQVSVHRLEGETPEAATLGSVAGSGFADANGNFRVPGLRDGAYRVLAQLLRRVPGHGPLSGAAADVVLAPGDPLRRVELALEEREERPREESASIASLTGTVTDAEGRPIGGAYVRAHADGDPDRTRQGVSDQAGRFTIRRLDPGRWWLHVQVVGASGWSAEAGDVTIVEGVNERDLRVGGKDTGEVSGRVHVRTPDRPLSSPEVQLALFTVLPDGTRRYVAYATADAQGSFRFRHVPPGRLVLSAAPMQGGLRKKEMELRLAPGETLADVDVALDPLPTGKLVVVAHNEQGEPVKFVHIEILRDGVLQQGSIDANSLNGVYTTHVEMGSHHAVVSSKARDRQTELDIVIREAETTTVEVVLRPPADTGE